MLIKISSCSGCAGVNSRSKTIVAVLGLHCVYKAIVAVSALNSMTKSTVAVLDLNPKCMSKAVGAV